MNIIVQSTLFPSSYTRRILMSLAGMRSWIMIMYGSCSCMIQLSSLNKNVSITYSSGWPTWRILVVLYRILGKCGNSWPRVSPLLAILGLCADLQTSEYKCVKYTLSLKSYMGDISGSGLNTRMGSLLTSWITIICFSWVVWQFSALYYE